MTIEELNRFKTHKVIVIGDIILDEYVHGEIHRMSAEAPIPVVTETKKTYTLGGAANVAANIQSLGSGAYLIGICGKDIYSEIVKQKLKENNITNFIIESERKTTVKSRIIVDGKQVVRIDNEDTFLIDSSEQNILTNKVKELIDTGEYDGVIIQDYNKGVLTPGVIRSIINHCTLNNIPTYVDPKFNNIDSYTNCTIFKPNLSELKACSHGHTHEQMLEYIQQKLLCEYVICTQGKKGLTIYHDKQHYNLSTQMLSNPDVSGAGDSTLAAVALAHLSDISVEDIGKIANIVGYKSCTKDFVATVSFSELGVEIF